MRPTLGGKNNLPHKPWIYIYSVTKFELNCLFLALAGVPQFVECQECTGGN